MASEKFEAPDLQKLIASLRSDADDLDDLWRRPEPQLLPVPSAVRGFRIRIDLQRTKPPVWRRVEVPGDILLPRLHEVIQAAMGWTDSHLHRFRTSNDRNAPEFLTQFDLDEGGEGVLEDDVRLDQVIADEGDRLWYDYDFGDDWDHLLEVEAVLDDPPSSVRCVDGRQACPPEDCGGVPGYEQLLAVLADPTHRDHRHLAEWAPAASSLAPSASSASTRSPGLRTPSTWIAITRSAGHSSHTLAAARSFEYVLAVGMRSCSSRRNCSTAAASGSPLRLRPTQVRTST